jgi:UDP-glucose 4-epimerase
VLEVLRAVAVATAREPAVEHAPRRPGDPPVLVASNDRARRALGWRPQRRLDGIVADAWAWMSDHPRGYDDRGGARG